MHLLPTNLASLADLCPKESTKFALVGVHLRVHGDGTYIAESTDAEMLLRVTGSVVDDAAKYPEVSALKAAPNGEMETIVPAASWSKHFRAAAKLTKKRALANRPDLRSVPVVIGKSQTTMAATDLEQTAVEVAQNVEGRFPPVAEVFPKGSPAITFAVDPVRLVALLKALLPFCDDGCQNVVFQVHADQQGKGTRPIVITPAHPLGDQKAAAIIMPRAFS